MAKQTNLAKRLFAIVISVLLLSSMGICAIAAEDTNAWLKDSKWGFEADSATIEEEWERMHDGFYYDSAGETPTLVVTKDAKDIRSGKQGLKLVADGIDFTKVAVQTDYRNGVSGKTLAMVGYIKTENLSEDTNVIVEFASDDGFVNIKHTITYTSELPEWTKFHYYPSGDGSWEYMKIYINGSGTVYLDDVGPVVSDNLIKNPSFDLTPKEQNGEEAFDIQGWYAARGSWDETWKWNKLGGGSVEKLENSVLQSMPAVWQPVAPLHKMQSGDVYKCSVKFRCADSTLKPTVVVLYTPTVDGNIFSDMGYLAFEKASDKDADGFVTYEATFTMPDKTHYGFGVIGPYGATGAIFDDLIVERLVAETATFSCRGDACTAFWPGNKITATSQIDANDGDSVTVLMALYNRKNNQLLGFSCEEKTFAEAGLGEASATLTVPKDSAADTLEAFVWRKGDLKALAHKAVLERGKGEEVVVRKTEVAADVWGFETNSLSAYEVKPEGTWVTDRVLPTDIGFTDINQVIYGQSAIVNSTDEPNGVKAGTYALKLTGLPNRAAEGDTPWGKSTVGVRQKVAYQELAANSGKHITIEGYVKVVSLKDDAYVRLSTHYGRFAENRMQQSLYLRGSEITGSSPEWETGVWIPVRITMPNQTGEAIWFAFSLLGEGEVYFDDFHFVEDKNLIMNGDFRIGDSNGFANGRRKIQNWTAVTANDTSTRAWQYGWQYDKALGCAWNSNGNTSEATTYLTQNAVYSNQMVPGNTYEIAVYYAEYDHKNGSLDGGGTPAVVIGGETVTLTKTDKKVTRGTGTNAREFTLYTADYTLPKGAAVPASYQLTTSGLRSDGVIVWYADFAIYAY